MQSEPVSADFAAELQTVGEPATAGANVASQSESLRRAMLSPPERADVIAYDWSQIGVGIIAAGGLYPTVVAGLYVAAMIASSLVSGFNLFANGGAAEAAASFIMFSIIGGLIGILWSMFVAALTLPMVYLVAMTLSLRTSIVRVGAFSGG